MAKRKEDPPKGSPAWMSTFSDLMNLLLCFFVLLFSMSTLDAEKYEQVVNSLHSAFSIMSSGGASVADGVLVSTGISQLPDYSNYFGDSLSKGDGEDETDAGETQDENSAQDNTSQTTEQAQEQVEQAALSESESMAENIESMTTEYGIQDMVQVDFNGQYVRITMNGSLLFDSGSAELKREAQPLVYNIAQILQNYSDNMIEIEGHCDNVPIHSSKYESNDVLSMYRALNVADYIRANSTIDPAHIVSTGRGSYAPIADNSTAEGRARNRRVEIKLYNSYNTDDLQ